MEHALLRYMYHLLLLQHFSHVLNTSLDPNPTPGCKASIIFLFYRQGNKDAEDLLRATHLSVTDL